MTNPHLEVPLQRHGTAIERARAVVVAVHGRNQSAEFMMEHVVERLALADVAWLLPGAADGSWYPESFMAPLEGNQPHLDHALAAMRSVSALACRDLDPSRVVWCGFSQGACLVTEHVARHPLGWGGLLSFTGGRIGPPGTPLEVAGSLDGMLAYFGVGDADEWVPVERVADTAAAFTAAGAHVRFDVFEGRPHEVSDVEIERAADLLARVVAISS